MVPYIALALIAIVLGYAIGLRHARRIKRRALQQLNSQSLELLETKTRLSELDDIAREHPRRERLLKLTMTKLQQANKHVKVLERQQQIRDRQAFIALSKMRLKAVQSHEKAVKVSEIARKATIHLKRLELASPVTQTIEAHEPKSYGAGEPVTVSVVDQARLDGTGEPVSTVSNRDSAKLTKLHSSNEATAAS